ncbi:MAG: DUF3632 domain-containing protein [Actinoplanes sp.]
MTDLFARLLGPGIADEDTLWVDWRAVIDAAADADDDGQAGLVALVMRVRDDRSVRIFGAQMREAWDLVPPDDRTVEAWTRINAFAARLTAAGMDFALLGLWSIGTALETSADVPAHLPAAVQWFKHAGPALGDRTFGGRSGRLRELAVRDGLTEGGFNVARWKFWRRRLEELARGGDPVAAEGLRSVMLRT